MKSYFTFPNSAISSYRVIENSQETREKAGE